jgi:hypothetical protein
MLNRFRNSIWAAMVSCRELYSAMATRRRNRRFLVLLPLFLLLSLLLAIVASSGALAPFVYPLF